MHQLPSPASLPATPFVPDPGSFELSRRLSPFSVLQRRRGLFAAIVVGFVFLVFIATWLSPKSYTTHVKFMAGNSASLNGTAAGNQTILPVLNAILDASNQQSSETYAEMLRQAPVLERVVASQQLAMSPGALASHITVKPVPNTAILDVAVTWRDPNTSARIANAISEAFVDFRRSMISSQAQSALAYIGGQIPAAREKLLRSQAALAAYETKNTLADPDAQTQAAIQQLTGLDTKLAQVAVDRRQAAAALQNTEQQLARMPATMDGGNQVQPNPVAAQLRSQLAQVDVQLKTALQQYTEEHPTVKALRSQEAELRRELAAAPPTIVAQRNITVNPVRQTLTQSASTLRSQIASDDAQLGALSAQRQQLLPVIRALPARAAKLVDLRRAAKQDEDVYNALQQKYNEARIAQTTTLSDISVIGQANPKEAEVRPRLIMNLAVGTILALFLGLGGIFAAEHLDRSVKSEEDVAERLSLPLLTSVPRLTRGQAPQWLQATVIDSFLQLVTSLRYASSERLKTIAFTSGDAQDGKSFVSLNTAIALAELEPRVLLVDADLRLPSLHEKLRLPREPGISDVLVGNVPFEAAVRRTQHEGLDIISAGTPVPNAFALLHSPSFDRFLEEARKGYQTVIIDTPACASIVDATVVCARADGTVYVVASQETDARAAERGLARLRSAGVRNVVGAVLNKVAPRRNTIGAYGELSSGTRSFPLPPGRDDRIGASSVV